jgi:hypothetical protein
LDRHLDEVKINQGVILSRLHFDRKWSVLYDYEFKVFSQWGEDGIIQHLTQNVFVERKTFIEFGVEDFFESNCRFLLMKDRWHGYVIDGSSRNIARLKASYFYWRYPLQARASFITRENVAALLDDSGFDKNVGILSVDVDGIDFFLLQALHDWRASIIIVEYNSLFGSLRQVTVPYDSKFQRTKTHWSNLYWGASLPAFAALLDDRGYGLVGVNGAGSNAFFVRRDLLNDRIKEVSVANCFRNSTFREARDPDGKLTFHLAQDSASAISNMQLLDIPSGRTIYVSEVLAEMTASKPSP